MSAPSIGAIGSARFDSHNDRVKGLLTEVVRSGSHLRFLLTHHLSEHTRGTRLNLRIPIGHGVTPNQTDMHWHGYPLQLEAFVPVRGHPDIAGLAYYGANNVRRMPSAETRDAERALFMRALEMPFKPIPNVHVDVLGADASRDDLEDLVSLYAASYTGYLTEFSVESVRAMTSTNMVLVVRDESRRIASVCVAESVLLEFPDAAPLHLVEISDAATRPGVRDHGYYSAAKYHMVERLRANRHGLATVITTEARANSGRVLRSNLRFGYVYAGYQPMHCVISSLDSNVPQEGKYGNLVIFYVP